MLPAAARMRRRKDFELAVRRGRRAGGQLLAAHLFVGDGVRAAAGSGRGREVRPDGKWGAQAASESAVARDGASPARVGFVVTRALGGAVVRNRVRRRLREVARARAGCLPAGSLLVIRANPRAADARQRDLAAEFDLVLGRLLRRQVRA